MRDVLAHAWRVDFYSRNDFVTLIRFKGYIFTLFLQRLQQRMFTVTGCMDPSFYSGQWIMTWDTIGALLFCARVKMVRIEVRQQANANL